MGTNIKKSNYEIIDEDRVPNVKDEPIFEVYSQEAEEAFYDSNTNDSPENGFKNQKDLEECNLDDDEIESEDDDVKMINATQLLMEKIDENLSKISYIDLTQDDEDNENENLKDKNNKNSNKQKNNNQNDVSPIVICLKAPSVTPSVSNNVVNSPILVRIKNDPNRNKSNLNKTDINETMECETICVASDDEDMNDFINNAMVDYCTKIEKNYDEKIKNKSITTNQDNSVNKPKPNDSEFENVVQLNEFDSKIHQSNNSVIKVVHKTMETAVSNPNHNLNNFRNKQESSNSKVVLNLKRIRELRSSSDEEEQTSNKKSSLESPIIDRKSSAKRLLSSSDESIEDVIKQKETERNGTSSEYFKKSKNMIEPSSNRIIESLSMPKPSSSHLFRITNESLTLQKTLEMSKPLEMEKNLSKTSSSDFSTNKKTILMKSPPDLMKTRKQSSIENHISNLSNRDNLRTTRQSKLISTEEIDITLEPDLNSIDMAKKLAIERLSNKRNTIIQSKKPVPKAYEQIKSLKCKESLALKKYMDGNKKSNLSGSIGLTQSMNIAKIENQLRLQSAVNEIKNNPPKEELISKNSTNKPKLIMVDEPSKLSIEKDKIIPQQPEKKLIKPTFINTKAKENDKNSSNTKDKISSNGSKNNQSNDLVGNILNSMNKQNAHNLNNQTNIVQKKDYIYKFENFISRVIKCNYDWLKEQEMYSQPPPVVTDEEKKCLGPIVETYCTYKDYFTTMFPLLLSETWQEITRPWKEMHLKKERKTYQSMPMWLKQKDKSSVHPDLMIFTCQIIIDSTIKQSPLPAGDDLLHFIIPINDKKKQLYNLFGVIFKCCRLKRDDERILGCVNEYLRQNDKKHEKSYLSSQSPSKNDKINSKNFIIYELQIYVKLRRYEIQIAEKLEYDLITSLSSTFRRAKALLAFQHSPIKDFILGGSPFDSVFWPDKNNIKNCGEVEFKFENLKDFNESQQIVILEASSLIQSNTPKLYFIQGPPGTGKSHTIVGVLNAMISRHFIINSKPDKTKIPKLPNLKVLLCSPSNGGCDELTRRLKVFINKSSLKNLNIVRVGRVDSMHKDCDCFFLDNLAKKKFDFLLTKKNCEKSTSLNEHYKQLVSREETMFKKIKILKSTAPNNESTVRELELQLEEVIKRKKDFEIKLKKSSNFGEMSGSERKKLEIEAKEMVLREADIIICTLNFSGNQILDCLTAERNKNRSLVSVVIIDEAAQCLELESLIPLRFGCDKIIQVGDPEQLPATVLSKLSQDCGLGQSLFERVYQRFRFEDNNPIRMLYVQYRMHSEICLFPSNNFYRGKLKTNEEANKQRSYSPMEPYLVFNIEESQEIGESKDEISGSIYNPIEAETILEFCKTLIQKKKFKLSMESIGIITPYQRQVQYMKEIFCKNNLERIEIGTVDGYQGREKDVILLSTVRAKNGSIGFLTNRQRLNVSLTRAKYALYIFCHAKTLMINEDWKNCIIDAERRQLLVNHFSIVEK